MLEQLKYYSLVSKVHSNLIIKAYSSQNPRIETLNTSAI